MNGVPRTETTSYFSNRTFVSDLALLHGKPQWRKGWNAFVDTLRTFFYPQIFFITMLNSAMIVSRAQDEMSAGYYSTSANFSLGDCIR